MTQEKAQQVSDVYEPLSLDDADNGVIGSQLPGSHPNQVQFVGTPNSSINFGAGLQITFTGGRFIHNHPDVVKMLRRLSRQGTGIHELESAQQVAAAKSEDPLNVVSTQTKQEAAATAVNLNAAGVKSVDGPQETNNSAFAKKF